MNKKCKHCHKVYNTHSGKSKYCSTQCKIIARSWEKFPNGTDYVECQECGLRARQLLQHIEKVHHITIEQYCQKYNCIRDSLSCKSLHEQLSKNISKAVAEGRIGWQKNGINPSKSDNGKNGRYSVWSLNFHGYDGLSDNEKHEKIAALARRVASIRSKNGNTATSLNYYLSRGYSESEAHHLLSERQKTFTLEKCIKKYGLNEGKRIFKERQLKWQATMNAKPPEELARINKAKAASTKFVCAYSQISQKLFNAIYQLIKNEYHEIYYATLDQKNQNVHANYEYEVILPDQIHRYFLDFYVKDNNKVIEFDGDYWHSEKRGNQKRDRLREENLKKMGFINILHVQESDYKADPAGIIQKCIEFIRK